MGYLPYSNTVAAVVGHLRAVVDDPADAIDALGAQPR
jgi:hypothetical protein